jgi:hypothetical protein
MERTPLHRCIQLEPPVIVVKVLWIACARGSRAPEDRNAASKAEEQNTTRLAFNFD